jgi:hypothetical protein
MSPETEPNASQGQTEEKAPAWMTREWFQAIMVSLLGLALLAIIIYGWQFYPASAAFGVICTGIITAGACLLTGALLGLLFGIPRSEAESRPAGEQQGESEPRYRANTNLEQISDWLTKILVGVGLTQLPAIRAEMRSLTVFVGKSLGGQPTSAGFAFVLIIYFSVCGFLLGYLWTRIVLPGQLRQADINALGQRVAKAEQASKEARSAAEEALNKIDTQAKADANALAATTRQLRGSSDLPPLSQDQMNEVIKNASPAVRQLILEQAREVRQQAEKDPQQEALIERTLPIFHALIQSDPENKTHRYHAQLAYALIRKPNPDLRTAEQELNKAIEIRGLWSEQGWTYYELNRALCRIMLDPQFSRTERSSADVVQKIVDDLRIAVQSGAIEREFEDRQIVQWLEVNSITKELLQTNTPIAPG